MKFDYFIVKQKDHFVRFSKEDAQKIVKLWLKNGVKETYFICKVVSIHKPKKDSL